MTSGVLVHSKRGTALVLAFLALLTALLSFSVTGAAASEREVKLVESWPPAGETLWLPPRSGNLVFSAPVQLASARITIFGPGIPETGSEAQRLTQGRATRFLEYALPLSAPGEYRVEFSVRNAVTGERIEGDIDFTVEARAASVGGGNHRHDAGHIYLDSIPNLLLRFALVLGAALIVAAVLAARSRGGSSGQVLARLGGLFVCVGSSATAAILTIDAVVDNADSPFAAVAVTPALWLFLPAAFAGAFEAVLARRETWAALLAAVPLAAVAASTDHGDDLFAFALAVIYAVTLTSAAVLIALTLDSVRSLVIPVDAPSASPVLIPATAVILALTSLALLPLHARGFTFNGDFAVDLSWCALVAFLSVTVSFALLASTRLRGKQVGALLGVFLGLALTALSAALLYLPPPTAGL